MALVPSQGNRLKKIQIISDTKKHVGVGAHLSAKWRDKAKNRVNSRCSYWDTIIKVGANRKQVFQAIALCTISNSKCGTNLT